MMPDKTFFLDFPPHLAFERMSKKRVHDRLETQEEEFYIMLYNGFVKFSEMYPDRIVRIDASGDKYATQDIVLSLIHIWQWNAEDWEDVRRTLKGTSADFVALPVKFYILVLGTLKNELVLNLYWEMIRYIRFPYLGGRREAGADCFAAGTDTKNETVSELEQKFEADYNCLLYTSRCV